MNKIYVDKETSKEVQDLSGLKTLEQINKEFNGNFTDITEAQKAQQILDEAEAKIKRDAEAKKEVLIQGKIREIAERELVSEGKLSVEGNLIKEVK